MIDFYKIIADETALKEFIEFLPDTNDSEQYYVSLFARKKYMPDHPALKHDKQQLRRFTSNKYRLFNKIQQLETKVGTYLGHNNIPVPQESLALYITPSPRDFRRISFKTIEVFAEKLRKNEYINPRQEVLNICQTTGIEDSFHVFDIDSKDHKLSQAREIIKDNCHIIETRGGYHIWVNPKSMKELVSSGQVKNTWYPDLKKLSDVTGNAMSPIPGTYQGNFIPKLIK